jgi:HlyD family secretion protein
MQWRRHLPKLLIAAVLLVFLVLALRPRPVLVDTESVSRGPMAQTVEDEGRTRVIDRFVISSPLAAHARRITLDPGDPVQTGDLLVVLDALATPPLDVRSVTEARARIEGAQATLQTARREAEALAATAELAETDLRRLRLLAEDDLIAPREIEEAETAVRRAEALERSAGFRVQTARHELEASRAALAYAGAQDPDASGSIQLRAPVTGEVLRRFFESSRVVQPGEPILEIGDAAALEVEVEVLSADAVRIEPGMRVLLERWGRPEPLEGRVHRIEPGGFTKFSALGVEEQRVLVIVDFTSPRQQWARLGDAFRVNARFVLWEADDVLRIATSALFRHGDGWAAFTVANGRARIRPVEIGERGGRFTRVVAGLTEGEVVIVHPAREVVDGTRVRARQE